MKGGEPSWIRKFAQEDERCVKYSGNSFGCSRVWWPRSPLSYNFIRITRSPILLDRAQIPSESPFPKIRVCTNRRRVSTCYACYSFFFSFPFFLSFFFLHIRYSVSIFHLPREWKSWWSRDEGASQDTSNIGRWSSSIHAYTPGSSHLTRVMLRATSSRPLSRINRSVIPLVIAANWDRVLGCQIGL